MYRNYSSVGDKYYGLNWSETIPIKLLRSLPSGRPVNVRPIEWEDQKLKKVYLTDIIVMLIVKQMKATIEHLCTSDKEQWEHMFNSPPMLPIVNYIQ